ncbi:hypothetical protein BGX30_004997 [Mortierella sp. GBA39]|nr:hypothetical protein BGX30_004997 [Mortierella sp. GBA39]
MLQIPPSVALKARSRQSQLHNNYSNDKNSNDGEEPEEEFRILQYPAEPWGRASRNRATAIIPSRRIISSLIEDISHATVSQDWTDTARSRRTRHASNTKRVALLKRARSSSIASVNNATESSDSGSTFNTRKSTTSSAKKRPAKQLRSGPPSLSDTLNTTTTTTTATTYLNPKKPTLPRKPPRPRYTETPPSLQDDHVEVLVVDDEDEKEEVVVVDEEDETTAVTNYGGNTSESDYSPGRKTMTQRQRQQERKARPRRRGLLQHDEGQGQAVKQVQELEEVHQEVDRVAEIPNVDGPNRAVERMDCVVIPVVDHPERSTAVRSTKKGPQLSLRTDTGKFTKKDSKQEPGLKTRTATITKDTTLTTQSPTKATTANGARPTPRRTIEIAPVLDMKLDAPRQTRSDARNNPTATPEPTKTVLPVNAPIPVQEHQSSSQQPSKVVGPSRQPSSTQVRAKAFHGWWLKRKENLALDGNLGIVVQGNMIEPKVMTWHTSTIKDAPEPTLVMTFTGSFYRLYGSIDVQKMEGNGFSKDMIKAFRNGFPANWKTILGKEYGKQAVSTASMGNERPVDKRVDTTGQNDHNALKRQEIPLTQQPRESVQRGKPVVQQGKPQLRQATQKERRIVKEITPEIDSPRMIGKALRGPAVAPVERAPDQVKSSPLPSQGSILGPPTSRTLNEDGAVEIVTPVASSISLSKGSPVSKATTRTTNNKPKSSPSSSLERSAPTSAAPPIPSAISTQPVSTWAEVLEEVTARSQSPTPRRASVPESESLREDKPALRRSSAPVQLITTMGTWKAVGPTDYGVDKLLDKALDGNLRMRSKAVVEQIRERTRQHPDLSAVVVDRAVEKG